jgi:hypothetical protein
MYFYIYTGPLALFVPLPSDDENEIDLMENIGKMMTIPGLYI